MNQSRKEVWNKGLGSRFRNGTLQPIAEKVMTLACNGLDRRNFLTPSGKTERAHLARLEELVGKGQTPADRLLDGIEHMRDMRSEIITRSDLGTGS